MPISRFIVVLFLVAGVACKAQSAPAGQAPEKLDRQIKLTIRSQYNVPPDYGISLGQRSKSDTLGFDSLPVTFSNGGSQKKVTVFLISRDNSTLARLEEFKLTNNPESAIPTLGRPIRGNPAAKVTIASFDDLECPFCARMNAELFPATEQHYGNLVRYVYLDFPIPQHPWAMRAAVDVNCVAAQDPSGYWNLVDYIHSHADEVDGNQQSVANSEEKLDALTRQEGEREKIDSNKLNACISKQDETSIRSLLQQGEALGVDHTPTLFVNGERTIGVIPQNVLWTIIDRAISDAGGVPPPQADPHPVKSTSNTGK